MKKGANGGRAISPILPEGQISYGLDRGSLPGAGGARGRQRGRGIEAGVLGRHFFADDNLTLCVPT